MAKPDLYIICYTAYPSGALEFTDFKWGSSFSIFSFLCSVLSVIVCPSNYHFGVFKLFLEMYTSIDLDGPQERSTILQFFFHLYVQFTTHGTIDHPMKQEYGLVCLVLWCLTPLSTIVQLYRDGYKNMSCNMC